MVAAPRALLSLLELLVAVKAGEQLSLFGPRPRPEAAPAQPPTPPQARTAAPEPAQPPPPSAEPARTPEDRQAALQRAREVLANPAATLAALRHALARLPLDGKKANELRPQLERRVRAADETPTPSPELPASEASAVVPPTLEPTPTPDAAPEQGTPEPEPEPPPPPTPEPLEDLAQVDDAGDPEPVSAEPLRPSEDLASSRTSPEAGQPSPAPHHPPPGYTPIPHSTRLGWHRLQADGRTYDYWYPDGQGTRTQPHAEDRGREVAIAEQRRIITGAKHSRQAPTGTFGNVGEQVARSRGEAWDAVNATNLGEIEARGETFAVRQITRRRVMGELQLSREKDLGSTPGAAYLKRVIYGMVAERPSTKGLDRLHPMLGRVWRQLLRTPSFAARFAGREHSAENVETSPQLRALYVWGAARLRRALDAARTVDEVREVLRDWNQRASGDYTTESIPTIAELERLLEPHTAKDNEHGTDILRLPGGRFVFVRRDGLRGAGLRLIADKHSPAGYRVRHLVEGDAVAQHAYLMEGMALGKRWLETMQSEGDNLTQEIARARRMEESANWDELLGTPAEQDKNAPTRLPRQYIMTRGTTTPVRVGGAAVPAEVSSHEVQSLAALRAVNFGRNLSEDRRRFHLRHLYGALQDLAEVLDVPPPLLSLNGRLSVTIASHGQGNSLASYFPELNSLNITGAQGGGTLAHEWGHFLDNVLGGGGVKPGQVANAMRAASTQEGNAHPAVRAAMTRVMDAIQHAPPPNEADVRSWRSRVQQEQAQVSRALREAAQAVRAGAPGAEALMEKAEQRRHAVSREIERFNHRHHTEFAQDARMLAAYAAHPHEMFARAFEAWVEDKLTAAGRRNTYLVMETTEPRRIRRTINTTPWELEAYPQGEERQRINAAFDHLFTTLRQTGELKKALERAAMSLSQTVPSSRANPAALGVVQLLALLAKAKARAWERPGVQQGSLFGGARPAQGPEHVVQVHAHTRVTAGGDIVPVQAHQQHRHGAAHHGMAEMSPQAATVLQAPDKTPKPAAFVAPTDRTMPNQLRGALIALRMAVRSQTILPPDRHEALLRQRLDEAEQAVQQTRSQLTPGQVTEAEGQIATARHGLTATPAPKPPVTTNTETPEQIVARQVPRELVLHHVPREGEPSKGYGWTDAHTITSHVMQATSAPEGARPHVLAHVERVLEGERRAGALEHDSSRSYYRRNPSGKLITAYREALPTLRAAEEVFHAGDATKQAMRPRLDAVEAAVEAARGEIADHLYQNLTQRIAFARDNLTVKPAEVRLDAPVAASSPEQRQADAKAKPWLHTDRSYAAVHGADAPHIAEISGVQRAAMSGAALRRYEQNRADRRAVVDQHAADWERGVREAYQRGEIDENTPGLSRGGLSTRGAEDVLRAVRTERAQARRDHHETALAAEIEAMGDIKPGDRAHSVWGQKYGTVKKVLKQHTVMTYEDGTERKEWGRPARMSPDDFRAEVERRVRAEQPPRPAPIAKSAPHAPAGRPGLALLPSKSDPHIKRWQLTTPEQASAQGGQMARDLVARARQHADRIPPQAWLHHGTGADLHRLVAGLTPAIAAHDKHAATGAPARPLLPQHQRDLERLADLVGIADQWKAPPPLAGRSRDELLRVIDLGQALRTPQERRNPLVRERDPWHQAAIEAAQRLAPALGGQLRDVHGLAERARALPKDFLLPASRITAGRAAEQLDELLPGLAQGVARNAPAQPLPFPDLERDLDSYELPPADHEILGASDKRLSDLHDRAQRLESGDWRRARMLIQSERARRSRSADDPVSQARAELSKLDDWHLEDAWHSYTRHRLRGLRQTDPHFETAYTEEVAHRRAQERADALA